MPGRPSGIEIRPLEPARADAPRAAHESFAVANYHGSPAMYRAAGFSEVGTLGSYLVMRRAL